MRQDLRALSLIFCCVCLPVIFTSCGSNAVKCSGTCLPQGTSYLLAATEQSLQSGQLLSFPVDLTTGALSTPLTIAGPTPPVSSLAVAGLSTQYLYAAPINIPSTNPAQVFGYSIDPATGTLAQLPTSPFQVADAITLNGASTGFGTIYLGATSFLSGGLAPTINAFSIGSDGSLSPSIAGSPYAAAPLTNALSGAGPALSGSSPFLYATEYEGNTGVAGGVVGYSVGAGGVLTEIPGSPFATPANGSPTSIVYNPMGYLYVVLVAAASTSPQFTLAGFSVNQTTGTLTPLPGSPFAVNGLAALVTDPTGQFLFTGVDNTQTIIEYQVNPSNGLLTQLPGISAHVYAPFFVWNQYLYASSMDASGKLGGISAFSINETTGTLTPVPGSPFTATDGAPVTSMTGVAFVQE